MTPIELVIENRSATWKINRKLHLYGVAEEKQNNHLIEYDHASSSRLN